MSAAVVIPLRRKEETIVPGPTEDLVKYLFQEFRAESQRERTELRAGIDRMAVELTKNTSTFLTLHKEHEDKDDRRHEDVMGSVRGLSSRLDQLETKAREIETKAREIETKAREIESKADDTGSWIITEKETRKWWKTQFAKIFLKVIEYLAILAVGGAIARLFLK